MQYIGAMKKQMDLTGVGLPFDINADGLLERGRILMDNVEKLKGYIVFEPTNAIEHYDLSLLDFISYDFDVFNDYLLFFINFFDYFIDKLDDNDIKYIELDTLYPVNEIIEIAKKYYNKEKGNLIYYQSLFKKCINFVTKYSLRAIRGLNTVFRFEQIKCYMIPVLPVNMHI